MKTVIYHIDVNSAYLSWEAKHQYDMHLELQKNNPNYNSNNYVDIRTIPAVIGGNQELRHGIVLAKSSIAKKYGIVTGEPLTYARKKCPEIKVLPPNHDIYARFSSQFIQLLNEFSPKVEQYSIDEAFCDMSGTERIYGDPVDFAIKLKDTIYNELGFTVNIGISTNKLLAKMSSDFKKPNMVHTLWPEEIPNKLWPLPIEELFFVGKSTYQKLVDLGINTIGQLASMDKKILSYHFKKHGEIIWNYANGIDTDSLFTKGTEAKSFSHAQTTAFDVTDSDIAKKILLSLCESLAARIRSENSYISVVAINITDFEFNNTSHQMSLVSPTNVTEKIYECAAMLFDKHWNKIPIRLLGVSTSKATYDGFLQYDIFDSQKYEKLSKLNTAIDSIRNKYGDDILKRATFINNKK